MDKESLKRMREIIVKGLDGDKKISPQDRVELMINLWHYLDEDNYEHNTDVLRRYSKKPKGR